MGTPHKHAELIKAWADGAEIECLNSNGDWLNTGPYTPSWYHLKQYRIKPEEKKPVVRWLWATKSGRITTALYSDQEIMGGAGCMYITKLEWSRTEFTD